MARMSDALFPPEREGATVHLRTRLPFSSIRAFARFHSAFAMVLTRGFPPNMMSIRYIYNGMQKETGSVRMNVTLNEFQISIVSRCGHYRNDIDWRSIVWRWGQGTSEKDENSFLLGWYLGNYSW